MESLFNKSPSIKLKSNIKHNNNYTTNSYRYEIKSSRDISGNFIVNTKNKNKKIIFLKLKLDIIFDDENTSIDYLYKKYKFIKDNNEEEENCEIKEEIKIKDMKKYNMMKIYDDDSVLVNPYIFIILIFLIFVELYKIYLYYISIYEEFTIRKVISLRNDLSQFQEYNKYNPKVKIIKKKINKYVVSLNNNDRNKNNINHDNINNYNINNYNINNNNINNININDNNTDNKTNRKIDIENAGVKSNNISRNIYKND